MSETVSVFASGAAFSLLFFENIKSDYDQDGFLLGNLITKETNKLTDADHRVISRERIIKIKGVVPCPKQFYFYNAAGKVDLEKIRSFLGEEEANVVGWYIFKRKHSAVPARLTLREKIVHKYLAGSFGIPMEYFSCCLLTSDIYDVKPTYSFCQTFIRYCSPKYENLPVHINNLSDPSYTFKFAEPRSELLTSVVKAVKNSSDRVGHVTINNIQEELQQRMESFLVKFVEEEQQLFKLEAEVKQLAYNLKLKREYGSDENKIDVNAVEIEVTENGMPEHGTSENMVENSPELPRKKRGRQRKQANSMQNVTDNTDDHKNENKVATPKPTRKLRTATDDHANENEDAASKSNRKIKTNFSYSEAAQRKKN